MQASWTTIRGCTLVFPSGITRVLFSGPVQECRCFKRKQNFPSFWLFSVWNFFSSFVLLLISKLNPQVACTNHITSVHLITMTPRFFTGSNFESFWLRLINITEAKKTCHSPCNFFYCCMRYIRPASRIIQLRLSAHRQTALSKKSHLYCLVKRIKLNNKIPAIYWRKLAMEKISFYMLFQVKYKTTIKWTMQCIIELNIIETRVWNLV